MYFIVLTRSQHKLNLDPNVKDRLGFIFGRFEHKYYYWEAALPYTHPTVPIPLDLPLPLLSQ